LDDGAISRAISQRPKTAKPTSTNVQGLKGMVEQIREQINARREAVEGLNQEINEFYAENRVEILLL